jgi:hypothetical protein
VKFYGSSKVKVKPAIRAQKSLMKIRIIVKQIKLLKITMDEFPHYNNDFKH